MSRTKPKVGQKLRINPAWAKIENAKEGMFIFKPRKLVGHVKESVDGDICHIEPINGEAREYFHWDVETPALTWS